MNFKTRKSSDVSLDITPLIDVVFLLLIFFMVSTTFDHSAQLNITLPTSSKEMIESQPSAVYIGLDAQGTVHINKEALPDAQLETIKTALSDALVGLDEPAIIISADAEASHQSVVKIMDAARQLNLVKITFATQVLDTE